MRRARRAWDRFWFAPQQPTDLAVCRILFFAVLFIQWVRQSMREAAREDRRLDLEERRNRSTPTA